MIGTVWALVLSQNTCIRENLQCWWGWRGI